MINLLPTEEKHQLRAARTNTLLIRYNIFLVSIVAFMGMTVAATYIYLNTTAANAQHTIDSNQARVGQYASVQTEAQQFRQHLATAKQILDNQVTYSKVIIEIANLIPSGVVLQNLSLDSQAFGSPTTLVAQAKDYASALSLKDSFSKSPLFSDVHFQSITTGGGQSSYPLTVNIVVTIQKGAAK